MQKCGGWCTIRDVPYPPVAKLDIAVDSDSKGWGFKSLRAGQKRGCRFCGILFFGPEGAEPPRNFATQNAALFRESMRKQRRMAATGKCRSKSHRGGGSGGAEPPTQFCDAKCSTFPRKHEKTEADGSNGKVPFKSLRGGGSEGAEPPRNFATQNAALFRESVRKQRQMAATGKCRSSPSSAGQKETTIFERRSSFPFGSLHFSLLRSSLFSQIVVSRE